MNGFKVGDRVIYTGETEPVLIDPLRARRGVVTAFYTDKILHVKFEDGTDGIIHVKNLKAEESGHGVIK